ncbi:hypothetical protein [Thermodesulforhabdus norvegica]|uniref:Uncharacterized protein n=1 Tax=Thermodesulforhabdus norvegica TaxID=39841 RepID=A0A1I4UBN2_9BACT|nr:hypothetical protein [Thermodesulforhabdus norvegica]SFM86374.1 hypothetical protein SAMN05660836_01767 [Thermodesulforhabdus norvegica]
MGEDFDLDFDKIGEEDYQLADEMALRKFRKNVGNPSRRRQELEMLLKEELGKPEEIRDAQKIAWLEEELKTFEHRDS